MGRQIGVRRAEWRRKLQCVFLCFENKRCRALFPTHCSIADTTLYKTAVLGKAKHFPSIADSIDSILTILSSILDDSIVRIFCSQTHPGSLECATNKDAKSKQHGHLICDFTCQLHV